MMIRLNGEATGYNGAVSVGPSTIGWGTVNGILATQQVAAAANYGGTISLRIADVTNRKWSIWGGVGDNNGGGPFVHMTGGYKTLSSTLSAMTVQTVNGTDTYDDGFFSIQYEY